MWRRQDDASKAVPVALHVRVVRKLVAVEAIIEEMEISVVTGGWRFQ